MCDASCHSSAFAVYFTQFVFPLSVRHSLVSRNLRMGLEDHVTEIFTSDLYLLQWQSAPFRFFQRTRTFRFLSILLNWVSIRS